MDGLNRKIRYFSVVFQFYFSNNFGRVFVHLLWDKRREKNTYSENEKEREWIWPLEDKGKVLGSF